MTKNYCKKLVEISMTTKVNKLNYLLIILDTCQSYVWLLRRYYDNNSPVRIKMRNGRGGARKNSSNVDDFYYEIICFMLLILR